MAEDVQALTNGDMDGTETHEMNEMNDMNGPEKGRKNEGFEDEEETTPLANDSNETTEFPEELPTDQRMNNEEDLTDADDALLINDTNEETEFRDTDEEMPPPPAELIDQDDADTETATEYENHTGTLQKNGELDTPEYTPPDSPVEGQTILEMENPTYDQVEDTNDKFKFVQYEGADEETTRLESRARFKRKTDCKCLCLSMLCFLVMLLAAAFAFFVAMFLLGSLDGFLNRNDNDDVGVGAPPTARPPGAETIDAPPINMITTMAQIELDREWDQTLDFPSSQDRNDLEIAVIAALDDTYRWGSTKYVYKDSQIDDFRRGPFGNSVFVRFISEFYDIPNGVIVSSSTPSLDEQYALAEEEMSQIVFQTLAAAIDEPTLLGRIQARQGSLELLNTEIAKP